MPATAEPELEQGVRSVLAEQGFAGAELATLSEIPGGASRQTWLVDAGGERFVLRRDPPGAESLVPQSGEFRLIGLAGDAGVPVPAPLALEPTGGRFGTAGMLLAFVAGDSVGPRVLRREELEDARTRLASQLGEAAARIHSIDVGDSGLPLPEGDPVLAQIEHWEAELERIGEPLPVVELGLRWLRLHRPEPVRAPGCPRRLPPRQPDRRRRGTGSRDRLGVGTRRRPGRGPGLALHPLLAFR